MAEHQVTLPLQDKDTGHIEFLRTNRERIPIYRVGPGDQFKIACVSESQAHDRAPSTNCLYVIDLKIDPLFIAAEIVPAVGRRFLLQDRVIEHRFVGWEKPREREVDRRCHRELYRARDIRRDGHECQPGRGNQKMLLTPSRYARSKRRAPTPTCIFVFMLLMSPGIVRGTETIIAAAARQFYERREGQDTRSTLGKTYDSICIPIPSMRPIHRGNVDMGAVYKPILSGKATIRFGNSFLTIRITGLRRLTSVTMIPVIGPRNTV